MDKLKEPIDCEGNKSTLNGGDNNFLPALGIQAEASIEKLLSFKDKRVSLF